MRHGDITPVFLVDVASGCEAVLVSADALAYPRHSHISCHVVGLVRQGSIRLEREGGTENLGTGDCFVIPPLQVHALRADAPSQVLNLCLDRSLVGSNGSRRRRTSIIAGIMGSLGRRGWLEPEERARLLEVLRVLFSERIVSGLAENDDPMFCLRRALENRPEESRRLKDMATDAHMDRFHLIRTFRKRYGLAPRQFQIQNRIRMAKREMLRPGGSLTRAALHAGFYDQSHFIRMFKRLYRITPGQYLAARRETRFSKGRE